MSTVMYLFSVVHYQVWSADCPVKRELMSSKFDMGSQRSDHHFMNAVCEFCSVTSMFCITLAQAAGQAAAASTSAEGLQCLYRLMPGHDV